MPGIPAQKLFLKGITTAGKVADALDAYVALPLDGIHTTQRTAIAEQKVLREFRQCLLGGSDLVIYDIGASLGSHAMALSKVHQVSSIVAFEPIPESFEQLRAVGRQSPKIRPINVALGNSDESMTFHINQNTGSSSLLSMLPVHHEHFPNATDHHTIQVKVQPLDSLVTELDLPQPDVIKLDVQGFEDRVIAGGEKTILGAHWLMAELSYIPMYADSLDFDGMYRQLSDLGFRIREVTEQLRGKHGKPLQVNALFERVA